MAQLKKVSIGIDVGGTNTVFGFVDLEGNCLMDGHIATTDYAKFDDFLKALSSEIEKVKKAIPQAVEVVGIGIGAPNGNYYAGTIEHAPNLQWKGVIPFIELFKKYYNVPMILTNDANAAAIGEMVYGAAKGMKNFIVVTLGTGLGSGIVVNGDLVYGADGFAGEMGHTFAGEVGSRKCGCGRFDCVETYASATGIKRTAFELMCTMNEPSQLRDHSFNQVTSKMIYDAAKDGDAIALAAFEKTGRILGARLADAVAYFSPEAIFLFGGLAKSAEYLFKPTMFHLEKNLLNIFKYSNKLQLLPS
ncbi:MAG: ROK family protein, partial [bacterium]